MEIQLDAPTLNEEKPISVDEFNKMLNRPVMYPETSLITVENVASRLVAPGLGPTQDWRLPIPCHTIQRSGGFGLQGFAALGVIRRSQQPSS